ncbi:unnamed protein product [Calicophoron daubneyi]|uniref:Protein HGH1 homolog n=1 Tax=Calicophoron daubneyi TaxID=300641 RepID=A0AAV2T9K6_CALDB
MNLSRLRALLQITAAKLEDKEDDDFIVFSFRYLLNIFSSAAPSAILKGSDDSFEMCLKCLTNMCSSSRQNELLYQQFDSEDSRSTFVRTLESLLLDQSRSHSNLRELSSKLVCNLTRIQHWSSAFFQTSPDKLVESAFFSNQSLVELLTILLNMTSQANVRRLVCSEEKQIRQITDLFRNNPDSEQGLIIAGILKNCCFEEDYHTCLLRPHCKLLESLLLPLCGPQDELHPDDRLTLPKSLQSVAGNPLTKRTESDEMKIVICEALLQLCSTSAGRQSLRSNGTYFVLRELHKNEVKRLKLCATEGSKEARTAVNEVIFHIEQVVDQLICEERERGLLAAETSLRKVEIDPETSKKLDEDRLDFIQTN